MRKQKPKSGPVLEAIPLADDHDVIALRAAHENQTRLMVLADQKANFLIGLIAVVLAILGTRLDLIQAHAGDLAIPLVVFAGAEMLAVLLALLVVMPRAASHTKGQRIEDMANPLFFGSFTNFSEQEFLNYLTGELRNEYAAREMLARDLYQGGLSLKQKHGLLKWAYMFAAGGIMLVLGMSIFRFVG